MAGFSQSEDVNLAHLLQAFMLFFRPFASFKHGIDCALTPSRKGVMCACQGTEMFYEINRPKQSI